MKKLQQLISTILLLTGLLSPVFSQNIDKLVPGQMVKKGTVTLADGSKSSYFNLNRRGDSISYYNKKDTLFSTTDLQNVVKITRKGNLALPLFLGSAACATIVLLIMDQAYVMNAENYLRGYLFITLPYTIIGMLIPRQKTIFTNYPSISLAPGAGTTFDGRIYPQLSLTIDLDSKTKKR
jgi:hypothetical protein